MGLRLPLSGSGCCPPASLPLAGGRPVHSWLALLWYLLSPSFCEQPSSALGQSFSRESSFSLSLSLSLSLFSLCLSHSLGCYLTLAPSDYPQGIQAWSLP